jgi:hypothetical protein
MSAIDFVAPIFGLVWGMVIYILFKQNKSKPELWPRIAGFGMGTYAFVSLMTASMLSLPKSEFLAYAVENLFWSLPLGIIGYVSGRAYAHRIQDKNNK